MVEEKSIRQEKEAVRSTLKQCLFECHHLGTEVRKMVMKNGQIQIRSQCVYCGKSMSDPIPLKSFSEDEIAKIPEYDRSIQERRSELYNRVSGILCQHVDMKYGGVFWDRYSRHLESEQWRERRALVIERANGVCELCETRGIRHIHHKSYENFGNELLGDLLGVCIECHEKLHTTNFNMG